MIIFYFKDTKYVATLKEKHHNIPFNLNSQLVSSLKKIKRKGGNINEHIIIELQI